MDTRSETPVFVMRMAIGLMATLAGLDKFFNILADWSSYVSPALVPFLPVAPDTLMSIVGLVELAVGIGVLTAWPVAAAYAASGWLLLVAVNLVIGGHLDIAVRDVVLSVAAFTLARLVQLRQESAVAHRPITVSVGGPA